MKTLQQFISEKILINKDSKFNDNCLEQILNLLHLENVDFSSRFTLKSKEQIIEFINKWISENNVSHVIGIAENQESVDFISNNKSSEWIVDNNKFKECRKTMFSSLDDNWKTMKILESNSFYINSVKHLLVVFIDNTQTDKTYHYFIYQD